MIAQMDPLYIKMRPTKALSRLITYAFFEGRPLTTKGRWINPLVFALFDLERNLPQLRKVEKPIFIVGTGRSGTTILGIVLSMHREVGFLNEPKALWHFIYPEEDFIGNYSRGPARYRLGSEDVTEETKSIAHKLYGAYLTATFSKRVVDKYPELIFRVPFVRAIFPDAKFLFLVRSGWDTCQSVGGWSQKFGVQSNREVHDWWGVNNRKWNLLVEQIVFNNPLFRDIREEVKNFNRHTDRAVVEWIVTMREGLRLVGEIPEGIYMVRYEEMISNPEKILSQISGFCELPEDRKFLEYGGKVLFPVPPKGPFDIHHCIYPIFEETMTSLGY